MIPTDVLFVVFGLTYPEIRLNKLFRFNRYTRTHTHKHSRERFLWKLLYFSLYNVSKHFAKEFMSQSLGSSLVLLELLNYCFLVFQDAGVLPEDRDQDQLPQRSSNIQPCHVHRHHHPLECLPILLLLQGHRWVCSFESCIFGIWIKPSDVSSCLLLQVSVLTGLFIPTQPFLSLVVWWGNTPTVCTGPRWRSPPLEKRRPQWRTQSTSLSSLTSWWVWLKELNIILCLRIWFEYSILFFSSRWVCWFLPPLLVTSARWSPTWTLPEPIFRLASTQ